MIQLNRSRFSWNFLIQLIVTDQLLGLQRQLAACAWHWGVAAPWFGGTTALPMEREGAKLLEGRVAWLILLVVVSVCVLFCVLCCLQNNPEFSSVTISHILKNENYELCFLAGSYLCRSIYDPKKRYSLLAIGWNKSKITVCPVKIQTPLITL